MKEEKNQLIRLIRIIYEKFVNEVINFLSIKDGADIIGTSESIKKDVEFKGHNVWILIFSIFIASIGLNTNSIPIIIGAMLISPLMGPILGVGLALGTIDVSLLQKSLKNLFVAVFVAVITSFIYFKLTPFQDERPEILARTQPQLFDVLIAIFGGLSGIIASSRSERSNVIPGVAIATALMPPLCTAGYGLATAHYEFFFGAFYLFLINAAGITLTTLVVVKYMGFPKIQFLDERKERNISYMIWGFWIVLIVPSVFSFYSVLQDDIYNKRINSFIDNEITFTNTYLIKNELKVGKGDSLNVLKLYMYGDLLDSTQKFELQRKLEVYGVEKTKIVLNQGKDNENEFIKNVSEVKNDYSNIVENTNKSIMLQNAKLTELEKKLSYYTDSLSVQKLNNEVKLIFPEIQSIAFGKMNYLNDSNHVLVLPTFNINAMNSKKKIDGDKLKNWFKLKGDYDSVVVDINYLN